MTIAEARENLRRLVVAVNRSPDHQIVSAADAYALAVLDEAVESGNRILVEVAGEDPIFDGHTIRDRIKGLGQ